MNKPTPQQIAAMINENEYGLPMVDGRIDQAAYGSFQGASSVDQSGFEDDGDSVTQMAGCAATSCIQNNGGRCGLGSIEINEFGGCEQYEASAGGHGNGGQVDVDDGRYEEVEDDQSADESHWQTGKWDPKGTAF